MGIVIEKECDIRHTVKNLCQKMYADIEIDNDLSQLFLNSINDGQCLNSDDLECPILQEEVELAISQLNLKKAPGKDGLPAEFYVKCKKEISVFFNPGL